MLCYLVTLILAGYRLGNFAWCKPYWVTVSGFVSEVVGFDFVVDRRGCSGHGGVSCFW